MRSRAGLAGGLAVLAGVGIGVALATGAERRGLQTFSYTTGSTTVATGDQDVARANCGADPVVGGGIAISPAARRSEVASSNPGDDSSDPDSIPNDLWEAWANNQRRSGAGAGVVSHVVCEAPGVSLDLVHVGREFPVPNRTTRTARRACPATHPVISGGVYLTGSGIGAEVPSMGPFDGGDADRRPDDGFRASASGDDEGAQTATVYALCSGNSSVRYVKRTKTLRRRRTASAVAVCPGIASATGGGAVVSRPTPRIELSQSAPWDSDDPDSGPSNGWSVAAYNGERKARELTVWAICVLP